MKKLAMLLSLIAMVALTTNVFAQEKGQIQFGLGGYLFASEKAKASGAKAISAITPAATVRYFVADKIGIDGGLSITKYGGDPAKALGIDKLGLTLLLGGRYYYWGQDKMKLNGGLDFEMFMGDFYKTMDDKGKEKSPMSLYITPAEFEYWPMEGGAVTTSLFYHMNGLNLGDNGTNAFGLELGIKIRLK